MLKQRETGFISNQDIDGVLFEFICQYFLLILGKKPIEKQYLNSLYIHIT